MFGELLNKDIVIWRAIKMFSWLSMWAISEKKISNNNIFSVWKQLLASPQNLCIWLKFDAPICVLSLTLYSFLLNLIKTWVSRYGIIFLTTLIFEVPRRNKKFISLPRKYRWLSHNETLPYRGLRASSALVTWVPCAIWWELTLVPEFPTQFAYFLKPTVMMVVKVSLDPIFMPLKWSAMSLVKRTPTYRWKKPFGSSKISVPSCT